MQAGSTLTFTATGDDAATDSRITLNTAGVPLGATVTETNVALIPAVVSQFTWTPTVAQAGSYVITYTATNDTFEQVLQSVTIFVVAAKPPVVSCAASLSGTYGSAVSFVDQVSDPQGEAVTVVVSVDGSVVSTDPIAATAGTTTIPLSEMFTTVGAHTVSINATNTSGFSSNCSTA